MWVLWFHASRRYGCNACPSTTGRPGSQIDSNMNRPWQPRQQLSWSLKSTRQTALKTSCKLLDQERRTSFCVKIRQSSIENVDQLTKPVSDISSCVTSCTAWQLLRVSVMWRCCWTRTLERNLTRDLSRFLCEIRRDSFVFLFVKIYSLGIEVTKP